MSSERRVSTINLRALDSLTPAPPPRFALFLERPLRRDSNRYWWSVSRNFLSARLTERTSQWESARIERERRHSVSSTARGLSFSLLGLPSASSWFQLVLVREFEQVPLERFLTSLWPQLWIYAVLRLIYLNEWNRCWNILKYYIMYYVISISCVIIISNVKKHILMAYILWFLALFATKLELMWSGKFCSTLLN